MGDEFTVDPAALHAAANQLDEHAVEVASQGEALRARTAGAVGRGPVGEAVDSAVRRVIAIVAHDISHVVAKFYGDSAAAMRKAAAETERIDDEASQAFDRLARGDPMASPLPGVTRQAFGGRGSYGGREFDPEAAGGPVVHLDYTGVRVTPRGVDTVESHLQRFAEEGELEPAEAGMLNRLRQISGDHLTATDYDLRFYSHELRESVRYRRLGYPSGQPADPDEAYELWNNVHTATLADYDIDERREPLYYPGLLSR